MIPACKLLLSYIGLVQQVMKTALLVFTCNSGNKKALNVLLIRVRR